MRKARPSPCGGHVVLPASGAAHRPPQQLTVRALVVEALAEGDPGGPLAFDLGADEVADARVVDELRRRRSQLDDCVRVGIACEHRPSRGVEHRHQAARRRQRHGEVGQLRAAGGGLDGVQQLRLRLLQWAAELAEQIGEIELRRRPWHRHDEPAAPQAGRRQRQRPARDPQPHHHRRLVDEGVEDLRRQRLAGRAVHPHRGVERELQRDVGRCAGDQQARCCVAAQRQQDQHRLEHLEQVLDVFAQTGGPIARLADIDVVQQHVGRVAERRLGPLTDVAQQRRDEEVLVRHGRREPSGHGRVIHASCADGRGARNRVTTQSDSARRP